MKTYRNLWKTLCSYENLELAYYNARKHKTLNPKVIEFDKNARLNLCILLRELYTKKYKPKPLRRFILRDPKTRTISVSNFRDRIVHHALVNVLHPIFDPRFIADSYASRKYKGTLPALKRFDIFKRKVSKNGTVKAYALKCDIKHYFETVDHQVLEEIISKKVEDKKVLWLIRQIIQNHQTDELGKGMPLGNWTSQFFANIYLNELDQYVKHKLKAKYYIRYVDDFIILHRSKNALVQYQEEIRNKLLELRLELHPNKCKIAPLNRGVGFLGFRVFEYHKLVRSRNKRKIERRLTELLHEYKQNSIDVYRVLESMNGWCAYALQGNTYKLRKNLRHKVKSEIERIQESRTIVPPQQNRLIAQTSSSSNYIFFFTIATQEISAQHFCGHRCTAYSHERVENKFIRIT
jgi:retron-type reverse transcriptase